jgi:hypothetical protein
VTHKSDQESLYLETLDETLWSWAELNHPDELDGGRNSGRPPVLKPEFADLSLITAPDPDQAKRILRTIPRGQRHKWFRSLRSSQALAQSVFGSLAVYDQVAALAGIAAECGRPAFFTDPQGWEMVCEHKVTKLAEHRATSVDVLISRSGKQVSVECKLTEPDFGTCSRPRLTPEDPSYEKQRCNGDYERQAGRDVRCALTGIGIRYWDYLPDLFGWSYDEDHRPCPFASTYQLARNAMAATVTPEGRVDPHQGHVLVVYDERNPAFHLGGKADLQWQAASSACLVPGQFRRISWQRLCSALGSASELAWLTEGLRIKYGFY